MDPPPPPNPHLHRATTEREVNLFFFLVMLNVEVMAAAAAAVHSVSVCNIPKNLHLKSISPSLHLLAQPSSRNGLFMHAPCCPAFSNFFDLWLLEGFFHPQCRRRYGDGDGLRRACSCL